MLKEVGVRQLTKVRAAARFFKADRSGAAAIMFALSAVPAIGLVGLGLDFYTGLSHRTRLDAAADAATIAAITTAQTYISNNSGSQVDPYLTSNAIAAGVAQAKKVFPSNAGNSMTNAAAVPSFAMSRTGQTISATVSYTGSVPTSFGKLFGVPALGVSGRSGSSLTMGLYLDFYLALDMSGSMGLPTSTAGQQQLMAVNPDQRSTYPSGCQFACHFPANQGYATARQYGITLRVDSVGKAVQNLIQTATATETLQNQYRIGVYPFITNVMQAAPLSPTFTAASGVASQLGDTYLDSGLSNSSTTSMGSGGTHFENLLPGMHDYIKPMGDGSGATQPKPFLFIVTDGADNNQIYSGNGNWTGSQPQPPSQHRKLPVCAGVRVDRGYSLYSIPADL